MKKLVSILALALSTQLIAAPQGTKVVYGDDNRVDVYESTNNLHVELARSTAAMIAGSSLTATDNSEFVIEGKSLESRGMCKTERFSKQMTAAMCSGFLVGDDLLVTAGHCITGQSACDKYKWVFDYKMSADKGASMVVSNSSVYSCKKIINRELNRSNSDDWALIQLDRKVTDRAPLTYRTSGKIRKGDELVVIGHPSGLPTKIADDAQVRKLNKTYFSANLDTYGGNSGSAVFNATTGVIEGILVRGATDYIYDYNNGCKRTNTLGQNAGRGEDVTYITNISELQK